MIAKEIEHLADVLMEKETNPNIDKEIIVYGLSSALEHGASIITTIVFGILFGLILESVVFLIAFSCIRTYAGGYHCQKAINCYVMSSGVIALVLAAVKFTPQEYMFALSVTILLVSVPILIKLAPMETPSKPLDEDERKYYRKKTVVHLGIECAVIPILFLASFHRIAFVICLGIMVSVSLVFLQK